MNYQRFKGAKPVPGSLLPLFSWQANSKKLKKITLRMKLTLAFLVLSLLQVQANIRAQGINLDKQHATLETVFKEIRKQSGYDIIYTGSLVRNQGPVSVRLRNATVQQALNETLKTTQLTYTVSDQAIVIRRKPQSELVAPVPAAIQQDATGVVLDENNTPLPGVTVKEVGTTKVVTTDQAGRFRIAVASGAQLEFSSIGYKSKRLAAAANMPAVKLEPNVSELNDVVVVGYGTLEKKDLTSAVSTLKQRDFVAGAVSPLAAIQGKVPGLNISSTNGTDPNAGISLQLRGVNSINAAQGPLVVIDGVPGGDINSVVKEDIESINVLRDASAAAIYGTRASGGVILITTRRPNKGQAQVSLTSEYFTETIRKRPEVLSGDEFVANKLGDDLGARTDWYKEVTNKNPFSHRQVLNVTGGSEDANVYFTLFKRGAEGIAIGSKRGELGGRVNTNFRFFGGRAELNTNITYNQVDAEFSNNDIFNMAMVLNPTTPVYDASDITGYNILVGGYDYWNPVAEVRLRSDKQQYRYLLANSTLKVNLTKDLFTSATVGVKSNNQHGMFYRSAQHRESRLNGVDGYASQSYGRNEDRIFEWSATFNKRFGSHSINAVGGYSYQDFNGQGFSANNSDFPVDGIREHDMGSGTFLVDGRAGIGSYKNPSVKLAAFFGRINYSFRDRYIVTATVRHEGSSKFAPGRRWGTFPGLSAAWRASEEDFVKNLNVFSDLKFRAAYGETGNEGFNANVATRMYGADTWFLVNGNWIRTYGVMHNQNADIRWEVKKELNAGLDFGFFNQRLTGRFDYYKRRVENMIYDISVSQPPAIHDKTTVNIGSLENYGYELELNYRVVQKNDFNYSTSLVASHNRSVLRSLSGNLTFADRKSFPAPGSPGEAVRLFPGQDIGRFFIWQFAGFTPEGKWMLYDKDGVAFDVSKRNKANADKRFIGNAIPKVQLSWNHTFTYKNWDASIYMRSWLGYDVFNMINMYYSLPNVRGQNVLKQAFDKHRNVTGEKELSDYWLEKGDFLKLDALSIGYTFSQKLIKPVKTLRLYAAGRDLLVFTKYTGLDPEVNINGLEPGFEERNTYPKTRTFNLGLQATF
ncbi:SusC/RagA family TonB-linked outer membrane protein [Pedobacter yulinensis]|uniref:SusC/RagA family TonB-linked outer membrane protein n=1 Tax=Pedobacter yulinensis TaxID=2126353 RepID=A0A2T3HPK7_9SPHI|nr:SusC/RagA family TonB-linked outer membrane protein [Pedobacter yulinensis]PST84321.1 SusC/RagA family TonB-linked outer membrane protein [Pedobacter yulinensis]